MRNIECDMQARRYVEIDVMKGLLAIFVVVGHAIQQYEASLSGFWSVVRTVIYSFHMAAFVFAAGFCAGKVMSFDTFSDVSGYLSKRAFRLLLPYVVWGGIYFVLRTLAGDCARIPYDWSRSVFFLFGYNPDGAMWFLWALFAASVLVVPFVDFILRWWVLALLWGGAAIYIKMQTNAPHLGGINAIPVFVLFLAFGLFVRSCYRPFSALFGNVYFGGGCLIMFIAACCARQLGWCAQIPWYVLSAPAGAMLTLILAKAIVDRGWVISSALAFIGGYAMAIYVLGEPVKVVCRVVFARLGVPAPIAFYAMPLIVLVAAIVFSRSLLDKSRVLSALLLGEGYLRRSKL